MNMIELTGINKIYRTDEIDLSSILVYCHR